MLREVFGLTKEDATGVGIEYGSFTTCKLGQIVLILKPFKCGCVCVCVYFQKFVESELIDKYHPCWKLAWAHHV